MMSTAPRLTSGQESSLRDNDEKRIRRYEAPTVEHSRQKRPIDEPVGRLES